MNYFHRQIQLWGEDTQNLLKDKKVLIVGSGGLGSSLAYALGSSGIGQIDVVDFDTVSIHNIHRQILFNLEDGDKFKAEIFKEKIEKRYDGIKINTHIKTFDEFIKTSTEKFDLILDATDNLETRGKIDKFAKSQHTPWIYSSVEAFHGQVCFMDKANFKPFVKENLKPAGIAAPIVMFIASFEANLALRYLANLEVKKDILYYLDISSGELNLRKFKL
ncbi:ThiF family protein [Campylobacter blaseri]|uniref:Thiamine biosynthesis protein ThiF n=1 Tax=Campylobacter blaseri TaxID=2042961 RepID=A0A2P8R0H9_9BACT|nr:ThiF family adenylyltransferase [Campylobacter blaseri]PSM52004.1 thiamine biosynthesis protein ThiF [Campylobacter blaseri]PSM53789.1 thiamine biosynthesis protein ThiF [Campylobacter blaseri]QKF85659.1 ThiF family protein [Campylobacter blaseri]